MTWQRKQYHKKRKQSRHARVNLCVAHCLDCRQQLQVTYLLDRFGGRCRSCWDGLVVGAELMASHMEETGRESW